MYWRNRIHIGRRTERYEDYKIEEIKGFPLIQFKSDSSIQKNDEGYPSVIVIQAKVNKTYLENEETFVCANEQSEAFSLYSALHTQKALSKIKLNYVSCLPDLSRNNSWIEKTDFPDCLIERNYDTLEKGTHLCPEKRSPQEQVPEQSLWSYGATYSIDFDVCQVVQAKFFTISVDGKTKVRLIKEKSPNTFGDFIFSGGIKIFIETFFYETFFAKSLDADFVHLYFRKNVASSVV